MFLALNITAEVEPVLSFFSVPAHAFLSFSGTEQFLLRYRMKIEFLSLTRYLKLICVEKREPSYTVDGNAN